VNPFDPDFQHPLNELWDLLTSVLQGFLLLMLLLRVLQAVRTFTKKLRQILKNLGFTGSYGVLVLETLKTM
jgi:hypothetical protein